MELASIAVEEDTAGRGLARAIIEALLAEVRGPLYLTPGGARTALREVGFR